MGYKSEQFLRIVDENLFCSICHEVFQEPVSCKDGHTFCSECIEQWLKTSRTCPMDNTVITDSKLVRNLTVSNIVDNLYVYCIAQESENNIGVKEGNIEDKDESELKCDWTGKLQSLAKHKETCPFQQVQCPNMNCNTNMQRREMEDHDQICEYKMVECDEQCGVTLIRRDLPNHKRIDCPEVRLSCPNGCEISIKRKNITTHRETCPFQQVPCPNVKCNTNMQRRELEDHDKICKYKELECEKCETVLIRHELQIHKDLDCPEEMVPCPNDCKCSKGLVQKLRRCELKKHMARECGNTRLQCPFQDQGCKAKIFRKDFEKHLQEDVSKHMFLVAKQNKILDEENMALSNRCNELSARLKKALDDLSTYCWTINDYPTLFRKHSGSYFRSPNFWLCSHSWFLELYPNGDQDSEGFVSLYLCLNEATGSTPMSFVRGPVIPSVKTIVFCRFTVISHNPDIEEVAWVGNFTFSKEKTTIGHTRLMTAANALSDDFCTSTDGILVVKCTIQLV